MSSTTSNTASVAESCALQRSFVDVVKGAKGQACPLTATSPGKSAVSMAPLTAASCRPSHTSTPKTSPQPSCSSTAGCSDGGGTLKVDATARILDTKTNASPSILLSALSLANALKSDVQPTSPQPSVAIANTTPEAEILASISKSGVLLTRQKPSARKTNAATDMKTTAPKSLASVFTKGVNKLSSTGKKNVSKRVHMDTSARSLALRTKSTGKRQRTAIQPVDVPTTSTGVPTPSTHAISQHSTPTNAISQPASSVQSVAVSAVALSTVAQPTSSIQAVSVSEPHANPFSQPAQPPAPIVLPQSMVTLGDAQPQVLYSINLLNCTV